MGYLNSIKAGALETWKVYKILPSVVGAQGALESGWGTSRLAKPPYNNQFGIKPGGDWTGKTITMPTREYVNGAWITVNEPFRWYDDPGESIRDHGAFFTSTEWRRNNYKAVVGETDYKKACWALQNAPAPYATDPGYAQKLINLIETHNLQAWDREAMAGNSNTVATQTQQTVVSKIVGRELSSAGRTYVKDLNVTMIGDSLGVGTKPHFESLVPKANYDVLGSRQITHATNSLNGTYILQQLKNAGNLKEYVVVILGTNRGVTEQEINNFVNIAGSDRKVIFVDTASEVGHSNTVSVHYENSAKRLSNVYYANWKSTAIPLRPQYYSRDGANGEYIHMTPTGYKKHSEFIAQALYEVATTNFSDKVAETTKTEFYDIKDLELNEDGLITYDVLESNSDGTSTKKKATKQTSIKGLYSPYGDSSIYNPKANQRYGFGSSVNNSNWRESYFEDNEIEDSVRLLELASAELLERQEPEMIYTVNLLEIPVELSIGDTGIFVDHEFSPPLYLQARVLSLTTSETNPSLNKVTIGNVTELEPQDKSALMALRAELQETRKDLESNWIGSISTNMTVVSTNGYVLGDRTRETSLVARVLKGKEDITNQYDNFTWERISEDETKDTAYNDSLANSVQSSVLTVYEADIIGNQSKFVARAFNAKGELVSHQEIVLKRVETAIWVDTDTPPTYATDGSTWVNQDGEQYVKVDGAWEKRVDQAQVFTVKEDIDAAKLIADNAKSEADDARQRAEDALTEVGISTDLAQTAKDLAQLAKGNAETAKTNASQAINDASGAVSQALSAFNLATSAKSDVSTISSDVDELAGQVSLKANQTVVDQLSGTVSNHTAYISANAQAIQARLTSAQVNTLVDGKGFSTVNYVDNQISATANSFGVEMTRVEGKIDGLQIGGRNLLQKANVKRYGYVSYPKGIFYVLERLAMDDSLIPVKPGDFLTASGDRKEAWRFYYKDSTGAIIAFAMRDTRPDTESFTYSVPDNPNITHVSVSYPNGEFMKLERGNKATDWSPAPEDTLMENDFTVFKNSYESTIDGITSELSKTAKITDLDGMVTESVLATKNYVTAGTMTTTLSNYAQTNSVPTNNQFNTLKNRYDSMEQTIGTNGNKIAQLVMTDSLFSTKVLESVDIGGRNYAVGTTDKMQYYQQILKSSGDMKDNTSKTVYTLADLGAKVGDTYTASIYIGQSGGFGSGLRIDTQSVASKYVSPKTMHGFATITWTVEEGDTEYRFYYANTSGFNALYRIEACKFQIEKGNKRTDWSPAPEDKANQSEVTQLANNWAVRMLNSKNDIVSQINLSDSTFLIEAKNIVGLGNAVVNGKLTVTEEMIAGTISADKITGGTLTGTTFVTTENETGFSTRFYNGSIEFRHQIFTLGHIHATVDLDAGVVNGFAVVQRPGYIFSINSRSNLPNKNSSRAVLQIPADSTGESGKLNIWANGGFRVNSDSLTINDEHVRVWKPFVAAEGFRASHEYGTEGASIKDSGNLLYVMDKVGSVPIHRFQPRKKDGTIVNAGIAIYEDGRVAVVKNGVWTQL